MLFIKPFGSFQGLERWVPKCMLPQSCILGEALPSSLFPLQQNRPPASRRDHYPNEYLMEPLFLALLLEGTAKTIRLNGTAAPLTLAQEGTPCPVSQSCVELMQARASRW